jgi:hypothetical protein
MKPAILRAIFLLGAAALLPSAALSDDIRSAGILGTPIKGNWSDTATWWGGVLPGPADNVIVSDGDTVTLDVSAAVVDLTVGDGSSGALIFNSTTAVVLRVTGNLQVNAGGTLRNTTGSETIAPVIDSLYVSGDFIHDGACLDFRRGSGPNYGVTYVTFQGAGNSAFRSNGPYSSELNEFNGVTIDKSGTGRVVLGSDITLAGGSSSYPATNTYFNLNHGIVQAGPYNVVCLSTRAENQGAVGGGSAASYVIGGIGRGMSSGSTATRFFPVGDENGYRPIRVRNATPGGATGHTIRVRVVPGNANTGSSTLSSDIDKVATVRYYKIWYDQSTAAGAQPSMNVDWFAPSYGAQDGVAAGNSNLRTAWSFDSLQTWTALTQINTLDTTKITDPPSYWNADSLAQASWVNLQTGGSGVFVAIARATGSGENSLDFTTVAVEEVPGALPESYTLSQNYPNPFNPSTTVEFTVPEAGRVVLGVFNVIGQSVGTLVDGVLPPGAYRTRFDAAGLSSGAYFLRLEANGAVRTRLMLLAR